MRKHGTVVYFHNALVELLMFPFKLDVEEIDIYINFNTTDKRWNLPDEFNCDLYNVNSIYR